MDRSTTEKKGKEKKVRKLCPHGMKFFCELREGNGLCEHKKSKYTCAQCNKGKDKTTYHCPHGKMKYECREGCGGGRYCEHGKQKGVCKACGGGALCKTSHCPTAKNPKYDGYCWYCFANLFPDKPVVRNYLT